MRKRIAFVMVTSCVLLMVGCGDLNNAENLAVADSQIVGNTEQTDIGEKAASENIDEGEDLEAEIVKELTMEVLLELYENDALTLKVEEEGLEGFLAYENMKPVSGMEDSLTGLYICELVYPYTS